MKQEQKNGRETGMIELKPCPFCGCKNVYHVYNIEMEPDGITCPNCHIVVRYSRIHVQNGERYEVAMGKMAEAWNRRAGKTGW